METHIPHLKHSSEKKGWHYVFEFLMLFLAVFCGFIAENWREQMKEHQREREFIHSIVQDLKSDTLQSGEILMQLKRKSKGIDSLLEELQSPEIVENSNKAFRLWTQNLDLKAFVSNDRTLQQLKSSGELRLIRNKEVSDRIMQYDQVVRNYYRQTDLMYSALINQDIYSKFFDFISLNKNNNIAVPLTEDGKKILNQAFAHEQLWNSGLMGLMSWLEAVHAEGTKLVVFIKQQYRLM